MMHELAMMQVGGAVPTSAFDLIRSASPVTRAVLVFLLVLVSCKDHARQVDRVSSA